MRFLLMLFCASASGQTLAQLQANYIGQHCGAIVHWNMTTFQPNAVYQGVYTGIADPNQAATFAPTVSAAALQINMNTWMDAANGMGCKYIILTAKHQDGFALWPTAFAVASHQSYSLARTSWYSNNSSPDVVAMFIAGANAHGLTPILFFSIWDLTFETFDTSCTAGASSQNATCYAHYLTMIEAQLTELLSDYGSFTAIWFDGFWKYSNAISSTTIYNFVKGLQPNCLVVNNDHTHSLSTSDIVVYEIPIGETLSTTTTPSEGVDTIKFGDAYWFYNSGTPLAYDASAIKPERLLYSNTVFWNAHDANYLVDFPPDTAGLLLDQAAIAAGNTRTETFYPTDLAAGAAVTVSSQFSGTASPAALVDQVLTGNTSAVVHTAQADTNPNFEVDLGSAQMVSRVVLVNDNRLAVNHGRLRDLTLTFYDAAHSQVSQITGINTGNNGYGLYTGNAGSILYGPGQLTVNFTPLSARYVNIKRTPNSDPDQNDARDLALMEMEIFTAPPGGGGSVIGGKSAFSGGMVIQ